MSRSETRFKLSDVRRAIAANEQHGAKYIIEILMSGTIRLIPKDIALSVMDKDKEFTGTLVVDDSVVL